MSKYRVKETPVSIRGSVFDKNAEVELTDEEVQNIGPDYFEKIEEAKQPEPPAPPAGGAEGSESKTDNPPAGGAGDGQT